ncbi:PQQ-dependent sugar dehydrogenase [Spongiimicrobium sp. 3-5]|uniref:PQQ-dependent sugar dehydrogenase n=1 Tax=Spongiimicrobium sp. 3-5 TaxID=3332596 RepID=UPI00397F4791
MKKLIKISSLLSLAIMLSCNSDDNNGTINNATPPAEGTLGIVNAFPELRFSRPVDFQSPADGTNRIFVVEQQGTIRVFENTNTVSESSVFLDIQDLVSDVEDEMGLLGLAFHPDYNSNGFFYVCYSASRSLSVVSRFQVSSADAAIGDPLSETVLLEIPQPFTNHNGGQLAFGPDGMLYIASGDGGSGGDPQGNAQNRANLLGAVLRIDVNNTEDGLNYAIPSDNPFTGDSEFRGEIFAYGLRNPWRISFDTQTGVLWAGDVGQDKLEEIDIIESGNNYGWNILEGTDCFLDATCDQNGLTAPVFEYNHDNGDVSITGGYVYRGNALPQLQGLYVYADFVTGRIWALTINQNPVNALLVNSGLNIASFGTDQENELYICSFDGSIYKFEEI